MSSQLNRRGRLASHDLAAQDWKRPPRNGERKTPIPSRGIAELCLTRCQPTRKHTLSLKTSGVAAENKCSCRILRPIMRHCSTGCGDDIKRRREDVAVPGIVEGQAITQCGLPGIWRIPVGLKAATMRDTIPPFTALYYRRKRKIHCFFFFAFPTRLRPPVGRRP